MQPFKSSFLENAWWRRLLKQVLNKRRDASYSLLSRQPNCDLLISTYPTLARQLRTLCETSMLFAGSRNSEMKHMVPTYLQAMEIIAAENPDLKFVMPLTQPAYQDFVEYWREKLTPELEIKYAIDASSLVMTAADIALVTSGTATLEMMLHKTPMVVAYKTSRVNYEIGKRMIKVSHISLPNIIAGDGVVPEFIQQDATPEQLSQAVLALLNSKELQHQQKEKFASMHQVLQQGASNKAANAVIEMLTDKE